MLVFLSCRCAVFNVSGVRDEAQGVMERRPKSLSWWWPVYCSYKPHIEGFLKKKIIHGIRELPYIYFVYSTLSWSWQPKWLHAGGVGIRVWFFLIDAIISQFLGDIVQSLYLPLDCQLSLKIGDFFFLPLPKMTKSELVSVRPQAERGGHICKVVSWMLCCHFLSCIFVSLQLCNLEASSSTKWLLKYWERYKHLFFLFKAWDKYLVCCSYLNVLFIHF